MTIRTVRCSLRESHLPHRYSTGEECDGRVPSVAPPPAPVLRYVFPLDGQGRRAFLHLPEDLSAGEAARLNAMLETLPLP